jgi:MSHA biogenesis protein MshL
MKNHVSPLIPLACGVLLAGCAAPTISPSPLHIAAPAPVSGSIPEPVQQSIALSAPKPASKVETYSVTVHKVPVQSVLFALARDAGLNVDIHPSVDGTVTLNALDQTLPQLLNRISRQVDMRYEIDGNTLTILPDTPYWRSYKVDYVNIARSTISSVNIATQISTTGGGSSNSSSSTVLSGGSTGSSPVVSVNSSTPGSSSGNNNSTTAVNNRSDNNFWYTLEKNIRDMLRPSNLYDKQMNPLGAFQEQTSGGNTGLLLPATGAPAASGTPAFGQPAQAFAQPAAPFDANSFGQPGAAGGAPAQGRQNPKAEASVIVNVEGGLIAVRATGRQHEKIQEFLDTVLGAAKRQVLIEATVVEVRLGDQYQQGINWQSLGRGGLKLTQGQVGTAALPSDVTPGASPGIFVLNYANPTSRLGNIATTIQLLESFGKVKVLSSPKISVLNNQTALLKVVDNNVFFSIKVTPAVISSTGTITTPATYESHLETVPVGFVMSVTPQISDSDVVTLNVRPTITRIVGYEQDPNPSLADAKVISKVPVIQAREMESVMTVPSGQTAMMGGLMQDSVDNTKDGVPGLSSIPLLGNLFSYRNENATKTELVIFMRPIVVKDPSLNGDFKEYRYLLPGQSPAKEDPYKESYGAANNKANGL